MNTFSINSTIKKHPEKYPYEAIKRKIVGSRYNLSLTFIGKKRAKSLNKQYRNKSYSPNVLSFPLDKTTGEIFICPEVTKNEAFSYDLSQDGYIAFLFIHGLLHLKGHDHGDGMDKLEKKYLKLFNIK